MTTVLLCHGFVQNARAFDVPGISAVRMLEAAGYRVRALNLRGRTGRAPAAGFSVYVGDAARIVEDAAQGGEPLVWIGHSMGGLIGASLPERARSKLAGLVTIGAPVIPGPARLHKPGLESALVAWSRAMHAAGRSFPGALYGRAFSRGRGVAESRAPLPIRLWKAGAMDRAALDVMLHDTFSHDSFAVFADLLGLISSGGARAGAVAVGERIASLRAPLLVIAGEHDDLAPLPSARLLVERATSAPRALLEVDAGHVDLLAGREAAAKVWGPVLSFVQQVQQMQPGTAHAPRGTRAADGRADATPRAARAR